MDGASWKRRSWMMKPVNMADKFSFFFFFEGATVRYPTQKPSKALEQF